MSRLRADSLVLVAALIWGVAFYFQKIAMVDIGPLLFTGIRALIACVVLAPLALRENRWAPTAGTSVLPLAMLGGLTFFCAGVVQQQGIITATITNTSFLTALYVVLTPFLLWLIRGEKPGLHIWIAALIAFLGVWTLGGGTLQAFGKGDWLVAASAVFWSLYMVATTASAKMARPVTYTCLSFATVAFVALPLALVFETVAPEAIRNAAVPLLYVGFLSSALTFSLLSLAVRHMSGSRASILLSTETLFAAAAGYVLLGERLGIMGWIGAGLVFAAIITIQLGPRPKI